MLEVLAPTANRKDNAPDELSPAKSQSAKDQQTSQPKLIFKATQPIADVTGHSQNKGHFQSHHQPLYANFRFQLRKKARQGTVSSAGCAALATSTGLCFWIIFLTTGRRTTRAAVVAQNLETSTPFEPISGNGLSTGKRLKVRQNTARC